MLESSLLTQEHVATAIAPGDAGIIIKSDGSFRIFTTGDFDPNAPKPEQIAQAEAILSIAVALSVPQVMDILRDMARDPNIVGDNPVGLGLLN